MNKSEIIKKVKALNLPIGQYAVFGSGPLAAHKIRETRDIDLIVLPDLYEYLKRIGWKEQKWPSGDKYLANEKFEVVIEWNYNKYNPNIKQLIDEADIIEEIPFVKLEEVLEWKKAFGREKDKKDLVLIKKFLRK